MKTYANQKIILIHKKEYENDFLQISNQEWRAAYKKLNISAFALYLYMAGNRNGFDLHLSNVAVKNAIGLSKSTYHRALNELEENGYIVAKQGNVYDFYTTPYNGLIDETNPTENSLMGETVSQVRQDSLTGETKESHTRDKIVSYVNTEIDKINNIDNINNIISVSTSSTEPVKENLRIYEDFGAREKNNMFLDHRMVGKSIEYLAKNYGTTEDVAKRIVDEGYDTLPFA